MSDCHSASATERRSLQVWRSTRWRSWLKLLWTLAWTEANFLFVAIAQFGHSRLLGSQAVGCYYNGRSMTLQRLLQERQSRSFVALFRPAALENLAFAIDRAPQAMPLAISLYEHRIKTPAPVTKARMRDTCSRRISDAKQRSKPVPPEPDGFIANINAPPEQQVFATTQCEREPDRHHHHKADHFGR